VDGFDWNRYAVGGAAGRSDSFTGLNPDYASSIARLLQDADQALGPGALRITSAYRSPELQARLFAEAVAKYGSEQAARKWVAPPGRSRHGKGNAIDFANAKGALLRNRNSPEARWLAANVGKYGLTLPMSWEPWHVEPVGERSGGVGSGLVSASSKGGPSMGLLDFQAAQEPQTFGDRLREGWRSGSLMDNLALAFNSMRLNPDQNLAQIVQNRQEQRTSQKTANRTAQWLMSQGREDLAQALLTGAVDAKSAAALALTPAAEKGRVVDAATLRTMYPGAEIAEGLYNLGVNGGITKVGGAGSIVNINNETATELSKKLAGEEAGVLGAYLKAGPTAASALSDMQMLDEVLQYAPQGPISGRIASAFPGISTAGAAAESIIKRVAPSLRVEGSGSTSDIEYNGMLQSLPSLSNYPEANAAISAMMKAKAQINLDRANIVRAFQNSDQSPQAAAAMRAALAELDSRSIMTPELQRVLSGLGGSPTQGTGAGAGGTIFWYDENGNPING